MIDQEENMCTCVSKRNEIKMIMDPGYNNNAGIFYAKIVVYFHDLFLFKIW
jgi:hypothetical protein